MELIMPTREFSAYYKPSGMPASQWGERVGLIIENFFFSYKIMNWNHLDI